jgi:hypothetical protein
MRGFRYLLAVLLSVGLSAPLGLAHDKGTGKGEKAKNRAVRGMEERTEKKGVEGREERSLGTEERTEKKGVEGKEQKAKRRAHHKAHARSAKPTKAS